MILWKTNKQQQVLQEIQVLSLQLGKTEENGEKSPNSLFPK